MSADEPVVIAQGPFRRMDEMRRLLIGAGIGADIVQPPGANANA